MIANTPRCNQVHLKNFQRSNFFSQYTRFFLPPTNPARKTEKTIHFQWFFLPFSDEKTFNICGYLGNINKQSLPKLKFFSPRLFPSALPDSSIGSRDAEFASDAIVSIPFLRSQNRVLSPIDFVRQPLSH
jgi:hypothetical protein